MRKFLPLLLVFMLVLAACGGGDDDDDDGDAGAAGIEGAETCDEVGEAFLDEMQVLLDELSDMSLSDFQSDEQPEAMTNFETAIDEIGAKGDELGCTEEDMANYLEEHIDELEADGPVPELLLQFLHEGIQSGEIFE